MSFWDYIKEKWYMFILLICAVAFSFAVHSLSQKFDTSNSNESYILFGFLIFLIIFIIIDFFVLRARANKLLSFIKNGAEEEYEAAFPMDELYYKEIARIAREYNEFRSNATQEQTRDLEFVTKWVHDVKVPISAMKLLLDSDGEYEKERLEMELLSIERSTQNVLYNIKSRSFYDDYKIKNTSTKKIISTQLKQFATFFSYKKIGLIIKGDDFSVLTDSKWAGYIISQFISNAVKYTKESGKIIISTEKKDRSTVIAVKNTGEGIPHVDIKNIFNRGYTSASRLSAYSTGYGLYLSKKLADKLGHKLVVASKDGEYAKFSIVFFDPDSF